MNLTTISAADLRNRGKPRDRSKRTKATKSHLETDFAALWKQMFPHIELEHDTRFTDERRYRMDFLHRESKTAIEIHGAIWKGKEGGHTSGTGITRDCEKNNLAIKGGWVVFTLTDKHMRDGETLQGIAETIEKRMGGNECLS